jgi:hypothetical protein
VVLMLPCWTIGMDQASFFEEIALGAVFGVLTWTTCPA